MLLIFSSSICCSERVCGQLLGQVAHRLAHPQLLVAQHQMPRLASFVHTLSRAALHGSCRLFSLATLLAA